MTGVTGASRLSVFVFPILFTTSMPLVTLPNTDVRQLTTSLRPMMPDQSTQAMLNAGSSDSLILTGFGSTRSAVEAAASAAVKSARHEREPLIAEVETIHNV